MVGFGSSLRLARRPGWEGAYLDYETLKLWLSQIEAVYEEDGHSRMSTGGRDASGGSIGDPLWDLEMLHGHRPNHKKPRAKHQTAASGPRAAARDYKDELFLESDSEAAYISIDDQDFTTTDDDSEDEAALIQPSAKPFSLSYSHEQVSSSDDDEDNERKGALCWGRSSAAAGSNAGTKNKLPKKQRRKKSSLPSIRDKDEDTFYNVIATTGPMGATPNSFFMAGGNDDVARTPTVSNAAVSSSDDYNSSLQYFPTSAYPSESTPLMMPTPETSSPPAPPSASLFNFSSNTGTADGGSVSPPLFAQYPRNATNSAVKTGVTFNNSARMGQEYTQIMSKSGDALFSSPRTGAGKQLPTHQQQQQQPPAAESKQKKLRRQRERRARRARRQKLVARRERKVPRHLRVAHAKARAITERFLGLLRAETEKVLLFAQARLGELADTAGSLRFPSFDEEYASNAYNNNSQHNNNNRAGSYEFGDGGMHPSASSSSDDGAGGGLGGRQWTDSSDDDEDNNSSLNSKANANSIKISGTMSARGGGLQSTSASAMMMSMPKSFSGGALSDDTPTIVTARTKDMEGMQVVRRHIAHFAALRKNRPVFQRNEQILGEDMLFLSAVEEIDGYTTVGVELMHVLKYICVNLIAVRKICRKHDRLLMNRMLGGYYQRVRTRGDVQDSYSHNIKGVKTLGGMVARISGDIYEAHPALIGQMNHYKLVGVYDKKIQKLANSRTVQVVSSCLALSLSEYEVARSRADALTRLNSTGSVESDVSKMHKNGGVVHESDGDSIDEAPSTASSISLTRLRYTIMSIFALREVSRSKMDHFVTYLSRTTLTFAGHPVVGEGLDGCSRETLDFIVSYDPDAALLRDSSLLFDGLKRNQWSRLPMADVMVSTLAVATTPVNVAADVASAMLPREEKIVAHAVSASPESKVFMLKGLMNGQFPNLTRCQSVAVKVIPPMALRLSRMSLFLYMLNYFMAHATTSIFVKAAGVPSAYSAIIIGAPNISAGLIAILHCWHGSRESSTSTLCRFRAKAIRRFMIFGSMMGIVGNALHAFAIDRSSVMLSIAGRFCLGFSAAEILQREITTSCVPAHVVSESAHLMLSRVAGVASGLFIGAASAVPIAIQTIDVDGVYSPHARQLQYASWVMMIVWLIHLVRVLVQLRAEDDVPGPPKDASSVEADEQGAGRQAERVAAQDSDSDSSSSADIGTPSSVMYRSPAEVAHVDPITTAFGGVERRSDTDQHADESTPPRATSRQRPGSRQWKTLGRIRKLISFHIGIPITLFVFFYVTFALEVFFTATPLITDRYFDWTGARAGTFLGCLAALVLPIIFFCEIVVRRYEERSVLKRALGVVCFGLFVMVNWESMFSVATRAPKLFADTNGRPSLYPYDWKLGVFQYTIGVSIVFAGLTALDGAALSLLSKVSPVNTRSIIINVGTMATFLGLAARITGDFQILMFDLSHKVINTDIVNSLVLPLILACYLLTYLVNRHFFFLM